VVKTRVINVLAAAALFISAGAMANAEAAEGPVSTPRVTVALGNLGDVTVVAMNDSAGNPEATDGVESTVGDREVSANASVAAAAAASTATDESSSAGANAGDANAEASAAANVAGGSSGGSGGSSSGDDDATSSAAPIFLSTGDDTCMGSSGVGVQGMEFGFSVGSSWTDENCVMLKNARELKNQGHDKAAKARLCMNDENALAFELAGEPCPRALPSTQAALAKLREWNPDYQAAAEPGAQFASTGAVTAAVAGASVDDNAGTADSGTGWASPQIDGFLAMVSSVLDHLTAGAADGAGDDVTAMDGLE
jgi:hypothetical protein